MTLPQILIAAGMGIVLFGKVGRRPRHAFGLGALAFAILTGRKENDPGRGFHRGRSFRSQNMKRVCKRAQSSCWLLPVPATRRSYDDISHSRDTTFGCPKTGSDDIAIRVLVEIGLKARKG
jgi:hypothetical protein